LIRAPGASSNITITNGVTSIDSEAFNNCTSLTSITIPASVTSIGTQAFYGCTSLTAITVAANNPNYASESRILYNKAKTTLIAYPSASGVITIPAGVTSIGAYAFNSCTGLTSVTIPAGVTTIGGSAFMSCRSISSITIPASVTSIGSGAFCFWTSSQTINVQGHANQAAANAAWGTSWRSLCDAVINYIP
jgi:hypothetical protein